jgi:hypothetical protein
VAAVFMPLAVQRRKSLRPRAGVTTLPSSATARYIGTLSLGSTPSLRFAFMERAPNSAKGQTPGVSRRAIVFGMAVGAAITTAATAADASARAFVAAIYDSYVGKNGNGVPMDSNQKILRYFEPSLAALMVKDQNDAARRKEVGTLDFDPFVDAQDWDIAAYNVAVIDKGADKASATVTFNNFGKAKTVVLDLVKIKNEWKISDIAWTPHENPNTLRALYAHS